MDKPKGDRIEGGRWGRGGQWQETETTTIRKLIAKMNNKKNNSQKIPTRTIKIKLVAVNSY